ncbi:MULTISPECIES: ion transporter [Thalassospira]|jgi:voltage-gated sodium channel|uniref:ion transporter n=1 Tax=Thalassospira TaxID=168934 RepID=UPI0007AD721A|nr:MULTISPECIES: ion transporter [Thalassospira]MEE3045619.1 ion transporter [Pseudomonadota bacterium]RCK25918.1 ion transporter [Thalassospira profundimaris]KZB69952.1 ion transporter [Thalassospira sp. MCCC 1A02491]MAL40455.1 ion transporter [Thalassospira sp.]MCC4239157.1 ion transporter [Thalassospira povalilytica]|tara:strand:+ start:642 stop:1475 length:834 start_codon:yes stop_codon:yes gene_type:complete|eukprot:NODE_945_length_1542_cov_1.033216_g934_i0.p1 GENE.NODE_945_length_1542_cov_1.033216_g934_i0~~NODE_945_length_1542_cov_1.033216_g934_i0.p1  ORF type:complete len:278 (+),score=31.31 NODE_945_length_1542_cov_1.033216_g934_i0:286-1119(+)
MDALRRIVESSRFKNFITIVIAVNAVILGFETSETVMAKAGTVLHVLDQIAVAIFVVELLMKLAVYRLAFFKRAWNVFDFTIVAITLLPAGQGISVLRALRILRAFRLISTVPSMRKVVEALMRAIPGMVSVLTLLSLVFYVSAVMATKLFGQGFPDWFGTIGASLYSLFQIMTLESWSMGIVRPVMESYPLAWLFFVPFILVTTFAVLNLFIAIVVDAMSTHVDVEENKTRDEIEFDHQEIMQELRALRQEMSKLSAAQSAANTGPNSDQNRSSDT